MKKVLIDTNIFIYDLDKNSIFHERAKKVLNDKTIELYTSSKNISEFISICTKLEINQDIALSYMEDIIENTSVLFPDRDSLLIFKDLLKTVNPKGNRVYDVEVASIMINNEINEIATVNEKDFSGIKKISIYKI
jgi:predicted nucleic acid-binding protein